MTYLLADWVGLTWIWDVPLSCLGSTAAAVQPNGLWKSTQPRSERRWVTLYVLLKNLFRRPFSILLSCPPGRARESQGGGERRGDRQAEPEARQGGQEPRRGLQGAARVHGHPLRGGTVRGTDIDTVMPVMAV